MQEVSFDVQKVLLGCWLEWLKLSIITIITIVI